MPGSPNEDALFKMTNQKATSSLKATYVNVVAIFVPLAGSDQKVTVVAGDRQAVKVEAQVDAGLGPACGPAHGLAKHRNRALAA